MKLKSDTARTLTICFGVAALSSVCVYNDTQDLAHYEHDPAGYVAVSNQRCLDDTLHLKLRGGALNDKSLTESFSLSSVLTPEDIESCKTSSLKSADKLHGDRLWTGIFGGIFGLMGVASVADIYRRRNKEPKPK